MIARLATLVSRCRGGRDKSQSERGAVILIAASYLVVTLISCALAVDLGSLAQVARENQKVADMAALDGARVLPADPTAAAIASATRNGYTPSIPANFLVECATVPTGTYSAATCATGSSTALRVKATSMHTNDFPFVGPGQLVGRDARAAIRRQAGFSIGSSVARVDASVQAPLFGRVLERWLGSNSGSISVTAVGYAGIASSYVTLGDLATQLGFGTVDELLTADLTVKQILAASAVVLNNHGQAAAVDVNSIVGTISGASVGNTTQINLSDMITVASGAEGNAASAGINVFQLMSGSAELANKNSFLSVSNAMVNVPVAGIGNIGTTLGLKVIEPPKFYFGPTTNPAPHVTTSQVEVTFTPTISVGISLPAPVLSLLHATGTLAVKMTGAGAAGTLTNVVCSGVGEGISVKVDTSAITTTVGDDPATPGTVDLRTIGNVVAATLTVEGSATGATNSTTLNFLYPGEFSPSAASKQTPSAPINTTVASTSVGNVTVSIPPLINVSLAQNVVGGAVLTAIKPLLDQIVVQLRSKELAALGVSLGIADVAALRDAFQPTTCGQPGLIG